MHGIPGHDVHVHAGVVQRIRQRRQILIQRLRLPGRHQRDAAPLCDKIHFFMTPKINYR